MRLNGRLMPPVVHPRQLGCPDIVPGLTQRGWWEREQIPWIAKLEASASVIREELIALREHKGFQPYRSPAYATKNLAADKIGSMGNDTGNWNVYYLYLHDIPFEENLERVPNTVKILQEVIPRNYFHCFFSALTPGTHINAHNGPTNKKLRVHLPLIGTEGARMRVGDDVKTLEQDKCIIFDDSFNHEAWYDGTQTRINLIVDLWNPELSDDEVRFFSMLLKSKLKGERKMSAKMDNDDHLYSIIEKTKDILKSNDDWWVN
jgi:aspartate beta-hydroxylase